MNDNLKQKSILDYPLKRPSFFKAIKKKKTTKLRQRLITEFKFKKSDGFMILRKKKGLKQLTFDEFFSDKWRKRFQQQKRVKQNTDQMNEIKKRKAYRKKYCLMRQAFFAEKPGEQYILKYNNFVFTADADHKEYTVYVIINSLDGLEFKKIGEASIENFTLEHIEIDKDYSRQQVGTNLIRAINRLTKKANGEGRLLVYESFTGRIESSFDLTNDGAALVKACVKKGIITDEQIIPEEPPKSPKWYK